MKSPVHTILPDNIRRSLSKFGKDLATVRRKRHLTIKMMAERTGLSPNTYSRIEKGDPSTAMGNYAMTLYVLGFGGILGEIADASRDEQGLIDDEQRLPIRVRIKRTPMLK